MAPAYNIELVALGGPVASGTATFQSPIARVSFNQTSGAAYSFPVITATA